jgi:hypothetical protein
MFHQTQHRIQQILIPLYLVKSVVVIITVSMAKVTVRAVSINPLHLLASAVVTITVRAVNIRAATVPTAITKVM